MAYAAAIEGFLAMLLRPQGEWETPLHIELSAALDVLARSLAVLDPPDPVLIDNVLVHVWQRKWTPSPTNPQPDPTMRYVILALLRADGSFKDLSDLTPLLAKLKRLVRSFYVRAMTVGPAPRPTYDDVRLWVLEGYSSTFDTVSNIQHQASAIVRSTQMPSNVFWTDPDDTMTMLYKGDSVSLAGLQEMFRHLEHDTQHLFEHDLLFDSNISVEFDRIKEDLSNRDVGYGFVSDKRNPFGRERMTFINHILRDPVLCERFCYFTEGRPVWNKIELSKWLQRYAEYSVHMLVRIEMLSGGPPRGTELTGALFRTTQGQSTRNLIAIGHYMVLLRTWGKTSFRDDQYRLIPHVLDLFSQILLAQDLALLRPFAILAILVCFPDRPDLVTMYQSNLFVNRDRLFTTPDMSKLIARYSKQHLLFPLTMRSLRHVVISYRRMCCPEDMALLEPDGPDDSEDHVAAEQSGHTAHTERMKYAVTPSTFAGCPEDILPRFAKVSAHWQQVMHVVPGTSRVAHRLSSFHSVCVGGLHVDGRMLTYLEASSSRFDALVAAGQIVPYKHRSPNRLDADAIAKAVLAVLRPVLFEAVAPPPPAVDVDSLVDRICAKILPRLEQIVDTKLNAALSSATATYAPLDVEMTEPPRSFASTWREGIQAPSERASFSSPSMEVDTYDGPASSSSPPTDVVPTRDDVIRDTVS